MCFETTKSARAKIAKKDIECWKILNPDCSPFFGGKGKCFTHKRTSPYIINKKQKRVLLKKEDNTDDHLKCEPLTFIIRKGYHSYKQYHEIGEIIRKFIIPAGTRYYENETEYVSETIMLVE